MKLTTLLLADHAQVRGGLLFVNSGGINRMWRETLPDGMGVCLAFVIEMDKVEAQGPHEIKVVCIDQDGGRVFEVDGGYQVDSDTHLGELVSHPIAMDLHGVGVGHYGAHDINVYIDSELRGTLAFWVAKRPE